MGVKHGYKQTELGILPEDWDVTPLGALKPFITSGSRGWASFYSKQGSLFVRITNLSRNSIYLNLSDSKFVKIPVEASEGIRTQLDQHDVLISITADIGIIGYVDSNLPAPAYINQHIALVRFDPAKICGKFVSYFLASENPQKLFRASTDTGAKAGMSLTTVSKIQTALPPLAEQRAIATTLSDIDALLDAISRLLVKKSDIKQAVKQKLLSGHTRLPEFTEEWAIEHLGNIATFHKGKGLPKSALTAYGSDPCIHYGELFTQYGETILETISRTNKSSDVVLSITNDVLMPTSDVTPRGLAKASCIMLNDVIIGGDILIIRTDPNIICGKFLSYVIRREEDQVLRLVTGTTVFHLYGSDMEKFVFELPSLSEQQAIVNVLSDIDTEINVLKARYDKTRDLKKAIMQELLTGRTRLVDNTSVNNKIVLNTQTLKPELNKRESHNWTINEAVVIAALTAQFGSEKFPLARKRCTKLTYLLHRYVEHEAQGYLKKAAGPYNPATRYSGPEKIAQKNGYVRAHNNGTYEGFVSAENNVQAQEYFEKWYGADAKKWLEQFRYKKTDELELYATVDMAVCDLQKSGKVVSTQSIKQFIQDTPEWTAKLGRQIFSDDKIKLAIEFCRQLFS